MTRLLQRRELQLGVFVVLRLFKNTLKVFEASFQAALDLDFVLIDHGRDFLLLAHGDGLLCLGDDATFECLVEMLLETTPKVYEWCANPWADDAAFLADQARLAFLLLLLLIIITLIILILLIIRLIILLLRLQAVLPAPLTPLLSR